MLFPWLNAFLPAPPCSLWAQAGLCPCGVLLAPQARCPAVESFTSQSMSEPRLCQAKARGSENARGRPGSTEGAGGTGRGSWLAGGLQGPHGPSVLTVNRELVRKVRGKLRLVVHSAMEQDVGLLRLYPGIPATLVGTRPGPARPSQHPQGSPGASPASRSATPGS